MSDENRLDQELGDIEPGRRTFIKRMVIGAAFATPVVSSFSMTGLSANQAAAAQAYQSGLVNDD